MDTSDNLLATLRRCLPLLAAPALVLAGCGTSPDATPAATTPSTTLTSTTSTTSVPSSPTAPASSTTAPSPTSATGAPTPAEAIEEWLHGQGYDYSGDCADAKLEKEEDEWCSTLFEDRRAEQVHKVGRPLSQYTYSLLLEKSGSTWSVVDVDEITVGP